MTCVANAYINALLADATYVNLMPEMSANKNVPADLNECMTPVLAQFIWDNFQVVSP